MRRCLIICALLLTGCGNEAPAPLGVSAPISADLLTPCAGWEGGTPQSEGQLIEAASAERAGRLRCNAKLAAIRETQAAILD
jgi:hypothetical protein